MSTQVLSKPLIPWSKIQRLRNKYCHKLLPKDSDFFLSWLNIISEKKKISFLDKINFAAK